MAGSFEDEERLSREPYGRDFAKKVIVKLTKEYSEKTYSGPVGVYTSHRDYCGIGLFCYGRTFGIAYVWDGMPSRDGNIISFRNDREAIDFLAKQSDYSMSGYDKSSPLKEGSEFKLNNQRLTRRMLENFLSKK